MILSNINTMALGEIIEESSGKITGERVLDVEMVLNKHATVEKKSFTDIAKLRDDREDQYSAS